MCACAANRMGMGGRRLSVTRCDCTSSHAVQCSMEASQSRCEPLPAASGCWGLRSSLSWKVRPQALAVMCTLTLRLLLPPPPPPSGLHCTTTATEKGPTRSLKSRSASGMLVRLPACAISRCYV